MIPRAVARAPADWSRSGHGISSPLSIGLDYCKGGIPGVHTVTVSLHDTNHAAIKDAAGKPVEASITITAAPEGDGGAPKDGGTEGGSKTKG